MKHRPGDPDPLTQLDGQWHVGRYLPGMFPMIELTCQCPKASCGLVAPVDAIACPEHLGSRTMRQIHSADDCGEYMRKRRRRKQFALR